MQQQQLLKSFVELVGFLDDANAEVRNGALTLLLPYTSQPETSFKSLLSHPQTVQKLMKLSQSSDPYAAHESLKALINLTSVGLEVQKISEKEDYLKWILQLLSVRIDAFNLCVINTEI